VPLSHLSLFRNRSFTIAGASAVVGTFAYLTFCFSLSLWIGAIQHQNPMRVGVLLSFIQGPAFVFIPVGRTALSALTRSRPRGHRRSLALHPPGKDRTTPRRHYMFECY
jgi:hypothetical protein